VLTDEVAAVQLSDRVMRKVRRELRSERNSDDDHAIARAIKVAVLSTVSNLLDHSAECPVRELRDVEYRHGRLIFVTEDGERLFENMNVNDDEVMSGFTESDARAYVRAFRRLKAERRR
jgi:hypothetical protein